MAPGLAGRHVHRAPRIATYKEWEDSPSPGQVGGAHVQAGGGQPGGGQEMVPATAETTPVQTEEEDSGEEIQVSMVADMGGGGG